MFSLRRPKHSLLDEVVACIEYLDEDERWTLKQWLAEPSRYYGDGGTIHSSGDINVETYKGRVVSVWFRCQMLPFDQTEVAAQRADAMGGAYQGGIGCTVTGVEVRDHG